MRSLRSRLLVLGLLALWLVSAFSAGMLLLWLMSPPGIGEGNWTQLWLSLLVVIGLPILLVLRRRRRSS